MSVSAAEFAQRFRDTLSAAQVAAGGSENLDPATVVELNMGKVRDLSIDEAAGELFLGEDTFFKFIDVSVHPTRKDAPTFFVRPSGHTPDGWERTFQPETTGPFKVMTPL